MPRVGKTMDRKRTRRLAQEAERAAETKRVRVQMTFEVDVHRDDAFGQWPFRMLAAGIGALIDAGAMRGPVEIHGGTDVKISLVTAATLKRRATMAAKGGG